MVCGCDSRGEMAFHAARASISSTFSNFCGSSFGVLGTLCTRVPMGIATAWLADGVSAPVLDPGSRGPLIAGPNAPLEGSMVNANWVSAATPGDGLYPTRAANCWTENSSVAVRRYDSLA